MIRFLLSFLYIFLLAHAVKAQNPVFLSDKTALQKSENHVLKSSFTESTNHAQTDFVYQRMEWNIDPAVRYISGKVTSYFKSKINGLTVVEFDLNDAMQVDSVTWRNSKINYTRNSNKIVVNLDSVLQNEQMDSLSIYYQGIPSESGFGSFIQDTHGSNSTPIIWTLSEPYGAMEWWPCKQSLIDKIDSIDIIVTSPAEYRTASNGILISEKTFEGKKTMHWKHRFPITTYLVAIAVTNYEDYSDYLELEDGRTIEILNYVYPETLEEAKSQTPVTAEIMELFNRLVGEYPFASEKYGHAQFGWGGGMEHQTMSFMGNFSFGLIAHELAHQWFGDYITLGSWQHIWLNEGFATYLTGLSYENLTEPKHWRIWKDAYKNKVLGQPDGSVFVYDTTSVSRIFDSRLSYAKGGLILHMQRWILGDDVFFEALQNYFTDEKVANGFAYSEDWISHIETAGDTILSEFFNDWLYGEGYPLYSINYTQTKTDSLVINLSQTTSHQSVDFFEMPVPIRVYNYNKTDSADFKLNHLSNNQEFIINPGFMIDVIVIDPEDWILCKTDKITHNPIIPAVSNIRIYPNPSSDKISFTLPNNQICSQSQLFSINGSLIQKYPGEQTTIDINNLPPGTYILQIETTDKIFKEKIVKQ